MSVDYYQIKDSMDAAAESSSKQFAGGSPARAAILVLIEYILDLHERVVRLEQVDDRVFRER